MSGFVYGGKFEQMINELCSPKNIGAAAKKFTELEKEYGPYTFGKFAKLLLPKAGEFDKWEKDAGGIPEAIRSRLTDVISANLKSTSPLPMYLKVGDNVDASHELVVKVFAHNRSNYIGLLMLCPNPELK